MHNNLKTTIRCLFGIALAGTGLVHAQAPTAAGAIELSGVFGGAAHFPDIGGALSSAVSGTGLSVSGGSGFKWLAGGTVGYAISKNLLIVFETNYNRISSPVFTYGSGSSAVQVNVSYSLFDYTGGVHYQLPVSSSRYVPYVSAGIGGVSQRVSASGGSATAGASETDFSLNGGGGVRVYIGKSWGVRPQIEVVHIPGVTYFRYSAGVFWQSKSE
jgi:hypothetical protein